MIKANYVGKLQINTICSGFIQRYILTRFAIIINYLIFHKYFHRGHLY